MQKVFVTHVPSRYDHVARARIPTLDLAPASRFGEIVSITDIGEVAEQHTLEALKDKINDRVREMTPNDYLLAAGDPIIIALCIRCACDVFGSVRVLRWSRKTHSYDVLEVM